MNCIILEISCEEFSLKSLTLKKFLQARIQSLCRLLKHRHVIQNCANCLVIYRYLSKIFQKKVVSLMYLGIVGSRGLKIWLTYLEMFYVRLTIPKTMDRPGSSILRDSVTSLILPGFLLMFSVKRSVSASVFNYFCELMQFRTVVECRWLAFSLTKA